MPRAIKTQQLQIRVTADQKTALKRLARQAGLDVSSYVLARALPPTRARMATILAALRRDEERRYALADLHDLLARLAPTQFQDAVADLDLRGLSALLQNYVAAMVEQAAYDNGEIPPRWVRDIEPLADPYFAVPFPRLRPHLLRSAPVPFKRRNLFIDSSLGDRV